MTQLFDLKEKYKVLEIGMGSGYQSAILSKIVESVFSVEINEHLYKRTKKLLDDLGYKNIYTKLGDGYLGWSENSPYDVIIVTCAAEIIPPEYIKQLKIKINIQLIFAIYYFTIKLLQTVKKCF